jgi:hypothetical protein
MCVLAHEALPNGQHAQTAHLPRCISACIKTDERHILVCRNPQLVDHVVKFGCASFLGHKQAPAVLLGLCSCVLASA